MVTPLNGTRMKVRHAAARPSAYAALTTQSRMQFQNTSDAEMRNEADKQDCSGELHAELQEEA